MDRSTATNLLLDFVDKQVDEDAEQKEARTAAEALLKARQAQRLSSFVNNNLFGEKGAFREFPNDEQGKLLAAVLTVLEEETQNSIDAIDEHIDGISREAANTGVRLMHLREAARNSVFLSDWKERIATIESATHYYYSMYSGRVIRWDREEIQETAAELEQLSGEIPENLTGDGFELAPSSVGGGQKIYLNGRYIATAVNARFSDAPTNGAVVAWLVVEQIDHCSIRGAQMSWKIFGWKDGLKAPEQIFEQHAYAAEKALSVEAPTVADDGSVMACICADGKESAQKILFG